MSGSVEPVASGRFVFFGRLAAVALFIVVLLAPTSLPPAAQRLAAVTVLMAVLWLTQALPIAATSLIPLAAFPLLGIQTAEDVSAAYANASVFLFLGGFIVALGIEKWGLHRRIALHIVRLVGAGPRRMVLGVMLAAGFLSMWISNTATTLLMLPIGLALVAALGELPLDANTRDASTEAVRRAALDRLAVVLLLGIAYASSIGGFTTLVGTPTNVAFQRIWKQEFPAGPEFSFGVWTTAVLPIGLVLLIAAWLTLVRRLPALPGAERVDRRFIRERIRGLGRPSRAEWLMLAVFVVTAGLWIFREPLMIGETRVVPGWAEWIGPWVTRELVASGVSEAAADRALHDSVVAIGMALLMFVIPARRDEYGRTEYLMDWQTAVRLPWGILLLFGGGFALANAFGSTGLSQWIGERFAAAAGGWPDWLLVASVCFLMTFLTELTSNVATVSTLLPLLAATAVSVGVDPRLILVPATISTSCGFMLPIGTPPNAIVFGTGRVRMSQMAGYGLALNLVSVVVVAIATFVLLVPQLGISLEAMPAWARR
jgi:solute carrier family 13 (sodium-dependent dicarboxylate transporter), member 2/3/5